MSSFNVRYKSIMWSAMLTFNFHLSISKVFYIFPWTNQVDVINYDLVPIGIFSVLFIFHLTLPSGW